MQLDQYQSTVLAFLFDKLPIGEDVDTLEFSLSGEFKGQFHVAYSSIGGAGSGTVVFTLPKYSTSVFLAVTYERVPDVARLLANLEDYERERSQQLRLGEVVITPATQPQVTHGNAEPYAMILLRTATAKDCSQVPDETSLCGRRTTFFLVVPLTEDEWIRRNQGGHDALIDLFQETGKSLYFFP